MAPNVDAVVFEAGRHLDRILAANRTRILLTDDELRAWRVATLATLRAWLVSEMWKTSPTVH